MTGTDLFSRIRKKEVPVTIFSQVHQYTSHRQRTQLANTPTRKLANPTTRQRANAHAPSAMAIRDMTTSSRYKKSKGLRT